MDKPSDIAHRLLTENKWSRSWAVRAAQALPEKIRALVVTWIHLNPYSTP